MSRVEEPQGVDWAAAYAYLQEQQQSILLRVAERMEALEQDLSAARRVGIRSVELRALETGTLRSVIAADGQRLEFAFHVHRDDVVVRRQGFSSSNTLEWWPNGIGLYAVEGMVRSGSSGAAVDSAVSTTVAVTGVRT